MKPTYTAETGKIGPVYVGRVLKNGELDWQSKRTYLRQLSALNAAQKVRDTKIKRAR